MKKTRCPYCGKKLNYFQAFLERKHGEYKCRRCGRNSTVYFSKSYKFLVGVVVLLAIVLVIIFTTPRFIQTLWGMLWVALPFILLYLVTPFFVRLVPIKRKKSIDYEKFEGTQFGNAGQVSEKTKVVPDLNSNDSTDTDDFMDISDFDL